MLGVAQNAGVALLSLKILLLKIMTTNFKKTALEIAVSLLAKRDFSKSEMEARLTRRGFDEADIQTAVQKLLDRGYIVETGNDIQKLREMAESYLSKKNVEVIEKKHLRSLESFLLRKGFDSELVREFLVNLNDGIL